MKTPVMVVSVPRLFLVLCCCTALSPVRAQKQHPVSAPEYTLVNYVLMGTSLFILVSLVFAILLLVRKEFASRDVTPRRQIIQVQPRPSSAGSCQGNLIMEDLGGGGRVLNVSAESISDRMPVKMFTAQ